LINLRENIKEFKTRKTKIISIATDSVRHLTKFSDENQFDFTMISDRGAKIAKEYNVYTFGNMVDLSFLKMKLAVPSSFLINKDGIIIWRYIGARTDRPSINNLIDAIDKNS